ncbi:hypothetical protein GC170_02110 [bacterium]|nr:hypothetical protein [bacterium]
MLIPVLCLTACLAGFISAGQDVTTAKTGGQATKSAESGPEEALRGFLLAIGTQDEAKLRSLSLPHDDFEWLLKGQAVPADIRKNFEEFIDQSPIRTLKAGEVLELSGGRELKVDPGDVSGDRTMLMFGRDPLPHKLRKVDGQWKVDPSSIVSARKAADAARKKKAGQ